VRSRVLLVVLRVPVRRLTRGLRRCRRQCRDRAGHMGTLVPAGWHPVLAESRALVHGLFPHHHLSPTTRRPRLREPERLFSTEKEHASLLEGLFRCFVLFRGHLVLI